MLSVMAIGCGQGEKTVADSNPTSQETTSSEGASDVAGTVEEEEPEVLPEGKCRSELSGELIDESLENQRPIAVMIDNESIALPHYGLTEADVIYEMMNSTKNGRVTRLMALVKDWESVERIGNVRSARTTNCILASEWNAILCHDGGPFYIDEYVASPSLDNLSGGFARIDNGKSREYTEYITTGEVAQRIKDNNIEREYNNYYYGEHFKFAREENAIALTDGADATEVVLPFPHNSTYLTYDEADQLYYYFEYGAAHLDPANDNAQLSFKNLIIQSAGFEEYDENGYMYYIIENTSGTGYYITNGKAEEITWSKGGKLEPTKYFDENGNEIKLNIGKTYVALVPSDSWNELEIK